MNTFNGINIGFSFKWYPPTFLAVLSFKSHAFNNVFFPTIPF